MKIELAKTEVIHFIGIGGIGMSGLSLIMKGMGFNVQGSDVYNNKNAQWMYVNLADGKDRIYVLKLLERSYECILTDQPLHLLIKVQLPKNGNITQLDENRRKFFTEFLDNLEYWVNGNSGIKADYANRLRFAWNHPDCRHVTFPQARAREFGKFLIELKGLNTRGNKTFN